jgi:hypothetical protein
VGGCHGRYQQDSVFELDEWERRDHFFSGADPADREYFLLNGNQQLSDDEEEEEVEKEEEEEEEQEEAEEEEEAEDEEETLQALREAAAISSAHEPGLSSRKVPAAELEFPRPPLALGIGTPRPAAPTKPSPTAVGDDPWAHLSSKLGGKLGGSSPPAPPPPPPPAAAGAGTAAGPKRARKRRRCIVVEVVDAPPRAL